MIEHNFETFAACLIPEIVNFINELKESNLCDANKKSALKGFLLNLGGYTGEG